MQCRQKTCEQLSAVGAIRYSEQIEQVISRSADDTAAWPPKGLLSVQARSLLDSSSEEGHRLCATLDSS